MKEIPSLARIFKWLVAVGVYFWVVSSCATVAAFSGNYSTSQFFGALGCIVPFMLIVGIMGGVFVAFNKDKEREHTPSDDFREDNLLYRYGYSVNDEALSIPLKPEWSDAQVDEFSNSMQNHVAQKIRERFTAQNVEVMNPVTIKDKDLPSDPRNFLKITFRSKRGSQVSHFIYYGVAGKYAVLHFLSRVRGKYRWHDVVDFVVMSPITVWGWGIKWLQNQYSIIAAMSKFVNNSFDLIDLKTYFTSSYLVVLEETRNLLKEKGLLTDELNQTIVNNITNSQNINISGSQGVSLGGVLNSVQSAARKGVSKAP